MVGEEKVGPVFVGKKISDHASSTGDTLFKRSRDRGEEFPVFAGAVWRLCEAH